jgi:hypothetical protein
MKPRNETLKTNIGCIAQCLSLCFRVLNEGVSIPGHDSKSRGEAKAMTALVLELYGGVLAFSTVAFLALAWASKSRPASVREATRESIKEGPL